MNIANTAISKLFVAFVAAAMLFTLATPAKAATAAELQAQIDALMAQIAGLSGGSSSSAACTFTRALTVGSEGEDVKCLQAYLTPMYFTNAAGATGYFGPVTAAAVAAWQTANGVTPAAGYFGSVSQAKYNALMAATPSTDDSDDSDSDTSSGDLSGEASLENFEIDDADESDVEEGDEEIAVAEVTVEFTDGDAEISRLDLAFTDSEGTDSDAWDVFQSFALLVDGEVVAEESASDEDDYLGDEDLGVIRFADLDIVGMEDEEVVITVAATINSNLEAAELGEWDVDGVAVRFFDADGVASTEDTAPVTDDTATFNIEVEGAGDDLDLKSSANDIDSTTLALDENDSTEHEVFVFKLDADDSDGDVTLENVTIDLVLSSSTRDLNEVVKDVMIEIDGESFSADDFDGTADTEAVDFDINGDVTIDAGEEVEVTVTVEFEDMDSASNLQGVTLTASVDTADIDAEGESGETVTIGGSDQDGNAQTLRSEGLVLDITSITETKSTKSVGSTDLDYGTFVFKFDVSAFGEDFYMDEDADVVNFDLNIDGVASTTGYTATLDIADADDAATADWMISEGETVTLTLTVETNTFHSGSAEVVINSVDYSAGDDSTEELNVVTTDANAWTSEPLILN